MFHDKIHMKVLAEMETEADLCYILSCRLAGLLEREREVIANGQ